MSTPPARVDITVLACTYNRADELKELLASAIEQETDGRFTFEVLVVDNNSKDHTRQVVEPFLQQTKVPVRYLFEARQGKSYALNTALAAMAGDVYLIADDDLILPPGCLRTLYDLFQAHPEASVIGGKVLPLWRAAVPSWLDARHYTVLAMTSYGEESILSDAVNHICLLAGAYRTEDVRAVGGYRADLGVSSRHQIGGVEDANILMRLYQAGRTGRYEPGLSIYHKVEPERLTRAYHRRWHTHHGSQYARMRDEQVDAGGRRLFDVPLYMYRAAVTGGLQWLKHTLTRRGDDAFYDEMQLRYFWGFFQQRRQEYRAQTGRGVMRELTRQVLRPR